MNDYSKERRELVAMLIGTGLTDHDLYPTKVLPRVPRGRYRDVDLLQISLWAETEVRRVTREAPGARPAGARREPAARDPAQDADDYVGWRYGLFPGTCLCGPKPAAPVFLRGR